MSIKLSHQELLNIVLEDEKTVEIKRVKHHRHNMEFVTVVFMPDLSLPQFPGIAQSHCYSVTYTVSSDEGIMNEGDYDCDRVVPRQQTITVWEKAES